MNFSNNNTPFDTTFLKRMKVFWMTFIAVFIVVSLQHLGVKIFGSFNPLNLITPLPQQADVLEHVRPQIEKYPNTYKLKKATSLFPQAHAGENYESAHAYVLVDYDTGTVLAEKALSTPLPMASLTKVMTAVVVLDIVSTQDVFTASKNIPLVPATHIAIEEGEQMSVKELLYATLLTSANDAAQMLQEGIDEKYGKGTFLNAMNEKAKFLGLQNTHFANPQGFDNTKHYSTAEDLAVLSHYALTHYSLIEEMVKLEVMHLDANQTHKAQHLYNWNGLIGVYPGAVGMKIGNTDNAKMTTIVMAERNGKKMLAVLLGAPGIIERDLWTAQLLDRGFEETRGLPKVAITEEMLRAKYQTWQ